MTMLEGQIRAALAHRADTTAEDIDRWTLDVGTLGRIDRRTSKMGVARYAMVAAGFIIAVGGLVFMTERHKEALPSGAIPSPSTEAAAIAPGVSQTTVSIDGTENPFPYTSLDYATTETWLPRWPAVFASEPPATTSAYGMNLCDDGYGTRVMRVDSAKGPAHAYSGTLCVFIELAQPRVDATTSCATTTIDKTDARTYARCQRRTVLTDTDGAGSAIPSVASSAAQTQMASFPGPTAWNQDKPFGSHVTGAVEGSSLDYGSVSVGLSMQSNRVCVTIGLSDANATGCVGEATLATGLAYGAFQNGDGPIEVVGVVPDDVTAVEIGGTVVIPKSNVWHFSALPSDPLTITVHAADGRTAATN